jgi:hypothetical protein
MNAQEAPGGYSRSGLEMNLYDRNTECPLYLNAFLYPQDNVSVLPTPDLPTTLQLLHVAGSRNPLYAITTGAVMAAACLSLSDRIHATPSANKRSIPGAT